MPKYNDPQPEIKPNTNEAGNGFIRDITYQDTPKTAPFLRTGGPNYDTMAVSNATGLACDPDEDMAQQQFKDEVDINTIVARFGLTGEMPEAFSIPQSGDFTNVSTFHEAMNTLRQAEQDFLTLPAHIRKRFDHDPGKLIEFMEDPRNEQEAREIGLLNVLPSAPAIPPKPEKPE